MGETLLRHLLALENPLIHAFIFHFSLFFSLFISVLTDHRESKLNLLNQMFLMSYCIWYGVRGCGYRNEQD